MGGAATAGGLGRVGQRQAAGGVGGCDKGVGARLQQGPGEGGVAGGVAQGLQRNEHRRLSQQGGDGAGGDEESGASAGSGG